MFYDSNQDIGPIHTEKILRKEIALNNKMATLPVLSLEDSNATNESICGGKGASLAQMFDLLYVGLPRFSWDVPKGLVVTTLAFQAHLEVNEELKKEIEELQRMSNQLCSTKLDGPARKDFVRFLQDQCAR